METENDVPIITLTDSPLDNNDGSRLNVENLGRKLEQKAVEFSAKLRRDIRNSPLEAVGIAAAAGFMVRFLPLSSLFATSVKVIAGFGPPVLLALGVVKLFESRRGPA